VTDGAGHRIGVDGAQIAQGAEDVRGRDALLARRAEVEEISWSVDCGARDRRLARAPREDQIDRLIVGPGDAPQSRR
jgi:hypothetical protein